LGNSLFVFLPLRPLKGDEAAILNVCTLGSIDVINVEMKMKKNVKNVKKRGENKKKRL